MTKAKTTIVFSINVHENYAFLEKQIEDIEANVLLDFVILINANEFMYNEIINRGLLTAKAANVELYPAYIRTYRVSYMTLIPSLNDRRLLRIYEGI